MRVAIQCMSKTCCSGHISHSRNVFNHALLESKISGTMFFAQWWVLDLTLEPLSTTLTRTRTVRNAMAHACVVLLCPARAPALLPVR